MARHRVRDERFAAAHGLAARAPSDGAGAAAVARSLRRLARGDGAGPLDPAVATQIDGARGGGAPLPGEVRDDMGQRFGTDFGAVRVHTDPRADQLNRAVSAEAFTTGRDIFFSAGAFDPHGTAGRELLAHELTHVVQQQDGAGAAGRVSQPHEPAEVEARRTARAVLAGAGAGALQAGGNQAVCRALAHPVQREAGIFDGLAEMAGSAATAVGHLASGALDAGMSLFDAEQRRADMIGQLSGLRAGIGGDVTFTQEEYASLQAHLGRLGALPGMAAIAAPVGGTTVVEGAALVTVAPAGAIGLLEALGAALAALTLGEVLLVVAAILAILLLIVLLFRSATGRPAPPPVLDPAPRTDQDRKPDPRPDPRPVPTTVDPPVPGPPRRRPRVTFGPVRAANTPPDMLDRIPDTGAVPVAVQVIDWDPTMGPITVVLTRDQPAGGAVLLDGAPTTAITGGTTSIATTGDVQSAPSRAGTPLRLQATLGGEVIGVSAPFAVAAIPQDMATAFDAAVDGPAVGMHTELRWSSDGRSIRSLDEVKIEEQLAVVSESGVFAGHGLGDHGDLVEADFMPAFDQHASIRAEISGGVGTQVIKQVWAMLELRSGSISTVRKSGFKITRTVAPDPADPGRLIFTLVKEGEGGTVTRFTTGAAAGRASVTIRL
jgi:hypothetical protein